MSRNIYSDNIFFKRGISALLGDTFIFDFVVIIDFDCENLSLDNINNNGKEIVGFVSSDLSYFKAEKMGVKSILDGCAKIKDILDYFLFKRENAFYKLKLKVELTSRERQLLFFVASGMTLADISKVLDVKLKTVYALRRNLMIKTGIRNRFMFYKNFKPFC